MSWFYENGQLKWVRFTNKLSVKQRTYEWTPGTHFDFLTNKGNVMVAKITVA